MQQQNSLDYSNIVAGVAMHVVGQPAVRRAVNVAQRCHACVTLVHSLKATSKKIESANLMKGASEGEARRQLEALRSENPEVERTKLIVNGKWSSVIDVADETDAELIVIGSYVHGQLVSLLGENSNRVVHNTVRDVLVVHSDIYDEENVPADYQRILVAVDVNDSSHAAVEKASWMAQKYAAKLTLLNIIEHFPTDRETDNITPENQDPMEYQISLRMRKLAQLAEQMGLQDPELKVMSTNRSSKHAVPAFAKEQMADLLVTGSHGQQGLQVLLGKTADGIVNHSLCDVLVVREV